MVLPARFALHRNFPNPLRHFTNIRYDLPVRTEIDLSIYNLAGQRIIRLIKPDKKQNPGWYKTVWNGKDQFGRKVASGPYVIRMVAKIVPG